MSFHFFIGSLNLTSPFWLRNEENQTTNSSIFLLVSQFPEGNDTDDDDDKRTTTGVSKTGSLNGSICLNESLKLENETVRDACRKPITDNKDNRPREDNANYKDKEPNERVDRKRGKRDSTEIRKANQAKPKRVSSKKSKEIDQQGPKEDQSNDLTVGMANPAKVGTFFQKSAQEKTKALAICEVSPNIPNGIKTLNLILDPSRAKERIDKASAAKARFYANFGQMDISKSYEKLFELLWFTRLPCFDVKGITSHQRDEMSVIKRCYWRGQIVDCSSIFVTRSTDRGMCCSFNQVDADEIYRDTKYRRIMRDRQESDKTNGFASLQTDTR